MGVIRANGGKRGRELMQLLDTPENKAAATAEFLRSPELRKEFSSFGSFYAYKRAVSAGLVSLPDKKTDSVSSNSDASQQNNGDANHQDRGKGMIGGLSGMDTSDWANLTPAERTARISKAIGARKKA